MSMTQERMGQIIDKATAETEKDMILIGRMRKALSDVVEMFQARPDMFRLCGPAEVQTIKAACDALNGFEP